MKKINIKNKEILNILNTYSDKLLSEGDLAKRGLVKVHLDNKDLDYVKRHTSDEFLDKVKQDPKHVGWPLESRGVNLALDEEAARNYAGGESSKEIKELVDGVIDKLARHFAVKNVAVHMYYPEYGFIGWHTNENATGLNLLFTYNEEGKGWFKYQDPITKEIIKVEDGKGWHAKVGYFGNKKDPDNLIWHCAFNESPRITIAFIIPDIALREDIEDELEDEDL